MSICGTGNGEFHDCTKWDPMKAGYMKCLLEPTEIFCEIGNFNYHLNACFSRNFKIWKIFRLSQCKLVIK